MGFVSRKCPSNAIVVNKAEKSWQIDPFKCVICGVCTEVCPKKCIIMDEAHRTAAAEKTIDIHVQEAKPVVEKVEKGNEVVA